MKVYLYIVLFIVKFMDKLREMLAIMQIEATKRNAPVFEVEKARTTPFRMLVFVMLSARTRDEQTLKVVEKLFSVADTPEKIIEIETSELEKILYGIGFYRVKAKNLKKMCGELVTRFDGAVPRTIDELLTLAGIGRKSANIVLASCFGENVIGVDTHVHRISNRLGLVKTKKPHDTENKLMKTVPSEYVRMLNQIFVAYGQTVCKPLSPLCSMCRLRGIYCPQIGVKKSQ